jgi:hypothetical protein
MLADTRDNIAGFKVAVNEVARVDILQVTELDAEEVGQITGYKFRSQMYSPTGPPEVGQFAE